jgi:hypothetical protein
VAVCAITYARSLTATRTVSFHNETCNSVVLAQRDNIATTAMDDRLEGVFRLNDHIKVIYRRSKHYGRTGIITKLRNPRLTIRFDDGLPGSFVDVKYARLIPEHEEQEDTSATNNMHHNLVPTVSVDNGNDNEDVLVTMFHRLAVQTAVTALADANDMSDVEYAINAQAVRIRAHALKILQQGGGNNNREG